MASSPPPRATLRIGDAQFDIELSVRGYTLAGGTTYESLDALLFAESPEFSARQAAALGARLAALAEQQSD